MTEYENDDLRNRIGSVVREDGTPDDLRSRIGSTWGPIPITPSKLRILGEIEESANIHNIESAMDGEGQIVLTAYEEGDMFWRYQPSKDELDRLTELLIKSRRESETLLHTKQQARRELEWFLNEIPNGLGLHTERSIEKGYISFTFRRNR